MTTVLDRVRAWNRRRISKHRMARAPRTTPFGFVMNGSDEMVSGAFEPNEVALVEALLKDCDRFINIGANTGFYCLLARKQGVPVVALEPVAQTAVILMQNLLANGFDKDCMVLPVAAGEASSVATIYGVGTGASLLKGWANNPESLAQPVPVVRLDDVIKLPSVNERVLVLMDVEGFEFPALRGATALLASRPRPVFIVEIAPDGAGTTTSSHIRQTFELMAEHGYAARCVTDDFRETDGPISGVTNYLFHGPEFDLEPVVAARRS